VNFQENFAPLGSFDFRSLRESSGGNLRLNPLPQMHR